MSTINFRLSIYIPSSATDPADYTSVLDQSLTFSTQLPPMTVFVPIKDNNLDEEDLERFTASLVLVTNNPRVQIAPPPAEVIIEDNDGKCEECRIGGNSTD